MRSRDTSDFNPSKERIECALQVSLIGFAILFFYDPLTCRGARLSVENCAVDMHKAFVSVNEKLCPNEEVCNDRFHLAHKVNEASDKVRRSEFKKAKDNKDEFDQDMLEPHRRFILVTRKKDLS